MTISTTTIKNSYSGNGVLTVFAYTFKIATTADIEVIIRSSTGSETVKDLTTHYSVSGAGSASGGNVTMGTPPATGETLVIRRATTQTQAVDLVENDPFTADSVEGAFDKNLSIAQELQEELDRSIKVSRTTTIASSEITASAADRASKLLSFDSAGNLAVDQELGSFRGNWATATVYAARDLVKDTSNNNIYLANTGHTSSGSQPISSNTDVAKWDLIVDAAAAATSATASATSATAAASSATAAASSATSAASSATTATTQASTSTTQAGIATAKAVLTAADAVSTAADVVSAAALLDQFDDKFLGSKSSNPTLDNDGNTLTDGAIFYHTGDNRMKVYDLGTTTWLYLSPTSAEQTNINSVATRITELGLLGTAAVVEDLGILGTAAIVADLNILGTSAVVADLDTVADNIAGVNSFADRYRIGSSDPSSSLDAGDLAYNTSANALKYYNGSSWVAIVAGGITDIVQDGTPQLGGDLDLNGNNLDFPTTPNISDCLDEDTMSSNSATKLATQQSIKAYVDNASGKTELYGFKKTNGTGTQLEDLIMTYTNGADDIAVANNDGTQTDLYDESILANQGLTFAVDANGNLNVTV